MLPDSEHERHNEVKRKRNSVDWNNLRARTLKSGGFGRDRVRIWTKLLNVNPSERQGEKDCSGITPPDTPPHHDERQITLDTDRSFVLYPVDPKYDRGALQTDLRELLVSLFRKRPRLSYFQGYHDIATVLFLTMPEELQLPCIEKLSLHRLRDSMGNGLEPVLGLLRVTKNLIRLRDRAYADVLERNSPLPFHALSNLLTLFSHDIPTLPLIQHIFDYLLCRPPIATVYLATAVILSRKQDVLQMEEEGDDGMVHSLLSSLPNLSDGDDVEESIDPPTPASDELEPSLLSSKPDPGNTALKLEFPLSLPVPEKDQRVKICPAQEMMRDGSSHVPCEPAVVDNISMDNCLGSTEADEQAPPDDPSATSKSSMATEVSSIGYACASEDTLKSSDISVHSTDEVRSDLSSPSWSPLKDGNPSASNGDLDDDESIPFVNAVHPPLIEPIRTDLSQSRQEGELRNHFRHQQTTLLTDLLRDADALYAEFPPSHSDLHLSSIMGPQSVIFTWSESFSQLPPDEEAEAMVQHPNLIVYPYIDIEEMDSPESSEYEEEIKSRWRLKGKERLKAGSAKLKKKLAKKDRKKTAFKRPPYAQMDKGTIAAGAVLVVGVAVAVYGIRTHSGDTKGLFLSFANTQGHVTAQTQEWKRVGGWMSGALTTMGERVFHAFDSLSIGNK